MGLGNVLWERLETDKEVGRSFTFPWGAGCCLPFLDVRLLAQAGGVCLHLGPAIAWEPPARFCAHRHTQW